MQTTIHVIGWVLCVLGCLGGLLTFFILMLSGSGGSSVAQKGMQDAVVVGIFAVVLILVGFIMTIVVIP
jgi:hypothetical protein